jgi:hypothetical protein
VQRYSIPIPASRHRFGLRPNTVCLPVIRLAGEQSQ